MMHYNLQEKSDLIATLCQQLQDNLPAERAAAVSKFSHIYYATAAAADFSQWKPENLYGSTLAYWHFIQQRQAKTANVRVFNPDYEQHGWQSKYTIIEVLQDDMPFLVDSLRMELNQRNLTIHYIHNAVISIKRNAKGELEEIFDPENAADDAQNKAQKKDAQNESLIFISVDRHTDSEGLQELQEQLQSILHDARAVVDGFEQMLARCDEQAAAFSKPIKGLDKDNIAEVHDFIVWLKEHFTFLGYDEFELVEEKGKKRLQAVPDSQLGLLKSCDQYCRSALINEFDREAQGFELIPEVLSFTKSNRKSRVHRPAYPDYISIKRYNKDGEVIGECRFLGLYTSNVYIQSSRQIPIVRRKVDAVMEHSGLHRQGHDWKELLQILEIHPRDDLFQVGVDELYDTVIGVLQIHERRQIRLFMRKDFFGQFYSCLVYSPRDIYSTDFRRKVQAILCEHLQCDNVEFTAYFSESVLTRTQFILRGGNIADSWEPLKLEHLIQQAARSWKDDLRDALVESLGDEQGMATFNHYGDSFPASYSSDFSPRTAVVDLQYIAKLSAETSLQMSFYQDLESEENYLNFKLFNRGQSIPLSDVLPVLENLGLRVIDEHPYRIEGKQQDIWIHDFKLNYTGNGQIQLESLRQVFEAAFVNIWHGHAVNDEFNRLVLGGQIAWRDVAVLRAYAAYMKQIRFPISQDAISQTLNNYVGIAAALVSFFQARFEPDNDSDAKALEAEIIASLDQVTGLNDDRVIRQYLTLIKATLRTNAYQQLDGVFKNYFSFKLAPELIPNVPLPKPCFEIFVYSPRVEGVHLRGGKVARGGLRWSDREEDYRTEVLGLVKAQQVKNAVIVPVGAKGGFVAKKLHDGMSREAWLDEGIACYKTFISGLLDVTDNLVEGKVVPPQSVVRHDEDDTYLVVAADKGTATFSDIANGIAEDYGFWLGDAFASGGSQGYDHKKMGITARGAWVSVERHFREMGLNTDKDDFSVIAIGDMSGDVFGNGMLLSKHICLQAAFNHLHIFIDPTPNAAKSWQERKRLFELPRSSWTDYDEKLISKGGGIFDRQAKSITLTPEIKKLTGLKQDAVTPTELLRALLQAPVDLIWNGGIGTYVKSSDETHADVGDKANDGLRINGNELRCKVVGEGGNLGMSQRARMEYAANGGRMNTDFIDNAGGVDCSDHEVNIKILLNQVVAEGDLTAKQRNQLLEDMTDEVADLVLKNNYRQVQSISLAEARSAESMAEYQRYIQHMEATGKLDRALEFLPSDEQLNDRKQKNRGLTRPELSVLISYSKAELKEALVDAVITDDPYLSRELHTAFPQQLNERYQTLLQQHRLYREIIATQIANDIVNTMGINFVDRLRASTGADEAAIARAFILARDVFGVQQIWQQVEALDHKVTSDIQTEMMLEIQHLLRRGTRWFVRNRRSELDCEREVNSFHREIEHLYGKQEQLLTGGPKALWSKACERYQKAGVPAKLAKVIAGARSLYAAMGIIEVAGQTQQPTDQVAQVFFAIGEKLELDLLSQQLSALPVENYWQALAREAFRDDLDWQQRALVANALASIGKTKSIEDVIERWLQANEWLVKRWRNVLSELKNAEKLEYAMYTVALRELFDLAKTSELKSD